MSWRTGRTQNGEPNGESNEGDDVDGESHVDHCHREEADELQESNGDDDASPHEDTKELERVKEWAPVAVDGLEGLAGEEALVRCRVAIHRDSGTIPDENTWGETQWGVDRRGRTHANQVDHKENRKDEITTVAVWLEFCGRDGIIDDGGALEVDTGLVVIVSHTVGARLHRKSGMTRKKLFLGSDSANKALT